MRKAIQLQTGAREGNPFILVLCDDGTIWIGHKQDVENTAWELIENVPQFKIDHEFASEFSYPHDHYEEHA